MWQKLAVRMLALIITEPLFYAVAIPAVIFLGLSKGGFSGLATASTPLLALYLPPLEAAALLLPIVICQDAISVYVYRREWSAWNLQVLLPGATLGMALGWLFASYVSDDAIRILIGVTALAFVASVWLRTGHAGPKKSTVLSGLFWGAVSGFTSFASQGGGPPFQVYTLPQQLPKMVFVGTATIFFATVNVMKIVPYFMLGQFSTKISPPRSPCCRSPCWRTSPASGWSRACRQRSSTVSPIFSSSSSAGSCSGRAQATCCMERAEERLPAERRLEALYVGQQTPEFTAAFAELRLEMVRDVRNSRSGASSEKIER